MKSLNLVTLVLLIVGGLNWGLVGAFQFDHGRPGKVGPETHLRTCGLDHRFESVPQGDRPQAHAVFDVLAPVDIPYATAGAARQDWRQRLRVLVVAFGVGVSSPGNAGMQSLTNLGHAFPRASFG